MPSREDLENKPTIDPQDALLEGLRADGTVVEDAPEIREMVKDELGSVTLRLVRSEGAVRIFAWVTNKQMDKLAPGLILAAARKVYGESGEVPRCEVVMFPKQGAKIPPITEAEG